MMTMKGEKKAIVKFSDEKAAEEILSRLGIM
jgi:large subunit ribosomal protein L23